MEEYLIPLGLDASNLMKDTNDFLKSLDSISTKSEEVNKSISNTFSQSSKSVEKVEKNLIPVSKNLEIIRDTAKFAGKGFEEGFNQSVIKKIADLKLNLLSVKEALIQQKVEYNESKRIVQQYTKEVKDLTDKQAGFVKGSDGWNNVTKNLNYAKEALVNFTSDAEENRLKVTNLQKEYNTLSTQISKLSKNKIEINFENVINEANLLKNKLQEIDQTPFTSEGVQLLNQILEKTDITVNDLENSLQVLKAELNKINSDDPAFLEISEQIESAENAIKKFNEEAQNATPKQASLKAELTKIKDELARLAQNGDTSSKRVKELTARASELQTQISNTNNQINKLSSSTKNLDGLISGVQGVTGAFAVGQGAVALFGSENEDLQKTLVKVNGTLAILQGLQTVMNTLNKNSAFSVAFLNENLKTQTSQTSALTNVTKAQTVATAGATIAGKAFSLVLKTLGIGLIITAIAYLVEYWDDLTKEVEEFLPAGESVSKLFDKIKSIAFGVGTAIINYVTAPIKALVKVIQGDWSGAIKEIGNGYNVLGNFQSGYEKQNLRNTAKYEMEREQSLIDAEKRELERRRNRGENVQKLEIENQKKQVELLKKNNKDYKDAQKQLEDLEDKLAGDRAKKARENAKKARDQAKRDAEKARKERESDLKKNNELILKYEKELINSQIAQLEEGSEKERKEISRRYDQRIEEIKKDAPKFAEAIKLQKELIENIEKERTKALKDFDFKELSQRIKLRDEGLKTLLSFSKESQFKELELITIEHNEKIKLYKEQFKDEKELLEELILGQVKATEEKKKEIKNKWRDKELKEEEEAQILMIELSSKYAKKSEENEILKQQAILQVKLNFAKKTLDNLISSGESENSLAVLNAKKNVQDLQNSLDDELKKSKGFSLEKLFGLDKLDSNVKKSILESAKILKDSLKDLTNFIVEQYDRQIDKKQEVIDQLDDDIKDLESRLDEEMKLREKGYANDVELIEAELEAKKAQRDEEIKQQEEIMEKKKEMQKAQLLMDTVTQLSSLITATTQIFEAYSGIPFIGQALAIAAITAMFAGFAVAKVKAYQNINDQKYEQGGWITGNTHANGGVKYFSTDGRNIELEDREYVTKRKQAIKHANLLEAINSGNYNNIKIQDLKALNVFDNFKNSDFFKANDLSDNYSFSLMTLNNEFDNTKLDEISTFLQRILHETKSIPKKWEDKDFVYYKIGNTLNKTKKKLDKNDK